MTNTLDALLEKLARDTWENLREAKRLKVRFGEETITDLLMLELRRNGLTTFKQTSLPDEAKYGTDFECWIGRHGVGWLGYAVQAKKLDFRTNTYRALGHGVREHKRQVDILKAYAQASGMTPRYCLYHHSFNADRAFLQCCSRSFPEEELGCTMTSIEAIERALASRGGKDFQSLQHNTGTVPWRCLAVCPRLQNALASRPFPPNDRSPLLDANSTIFSELPPGVSALYERHREIQSRHPDISFEEGEEEVDFKQMGIGVDSGRMDYWEEDLPPLIIPKRVYILELPECPPSAQL